ncbi:MAG: pyridoxal phosphate-dependent aminotransferase [Coriobacteriales bacterium]
MLNERMIGLGSAPNAIRSLFAYGLQRKAEIGEDKVFDYSIGNPSVPAPPQVAECIKRMMEEDPVALHSYTPSPGTFEARKAVADHIRRRFGVEADPAQVYLTHGAAAALAICLSAVACPGDEVIVPTPYFTEYKTWIEQAGATIVEVPCQVPSFQLDTEAIEAAITPKTAAIIVDSPNNPVGAVYSRENLEALAAVLSKKEAEYGTKIYLIADEPYRAITYGAEVPYIPCIYPRTLVCYSFSKTLSLPGERLGYIYVSNLMDNVQETTYAIQGSGRSLGYICCSALFQRVLIECIDLPSDVEAYRTNRQVLTEGLSKIGYEYVEPQGAFYLWVKALEDDDLAFAERAKQHELLVCPSSGFGGKGYVRMSYCIARETIENSMPALQALWDSYHQA